LHALAAVGVAVAGFLLAGGTAAAEPASFNCDASALRLALLGQVTIEPVTANQGQPVCQNANGTLAQVSGGGLPAPLHASVGAAQTQVSSDATTAQAIGGLGGLGGGLPPALAAVVAQAVAAAQAAVKPVLASVPPISVTPPVGPPVTVDISAAAQALLSEIGATNTDLIDLTLATAYAQAKCVNGAPQLTGAAQLAALSVLGQPIPTDAAATQAVNVINTQSISLSKIDISQLPLPPSLSILPLATVQALIQPILNALPPISVPAQLAQVTVSPDERVVANGQLTERALHVIVGLLGQTLLNSVFGEARVSNASVKCATAPPAVTPAGLALQCTTRKLTLIDVLQHGNHVVLLGAADKKLVGQRVSIYYLVGHKKVATALVGSDGLFRARAPLPPRRQRFTNRARYQAQDNAGEKSLNLKLHRRMVVDSIRVANGKVTISGRVIRPLASPVAPIHIQRRVSCTSTVNVERVMPKADGRFTATLAAPPNTQAAVYRAATQVRKVVTNPKRFPTFTLPREVAL
jgi:hypothetical protein